MMTRKQFFQRSLVGSLLALVFPSLILAKEPEKVTISCTKDSLSTNAGSLLREDVRKYPLTYDEAYTKIRLTNIYKPIEVHVARVDMFGKTIENCFGGGLTDTKKKHDFEMVVRGNVVRETYKFIISYQYLNSASKVNIHVPATRLMKDGTFEWPAPQTFHNQAGTTSLMYTLMIGEMMLSIVEGNLFLDEQGFVVERFTDHIDIHLS